VDMGDPEAGHYWVIMPKQHIPREYRQLARMTVVGRVTGTQRSVTEPGAVAPLRARLGDKSCA